MVVKIVHSGIVSPNQHFKNVCTGQFLGGTNLMKNEGARAFFRNRGHNLLLELCSLTNPEEAGTLRRRDRRLLCRLSLRESSGVSPSERPREAALLSRSERRQCRSLTRCNEEPSGPSSLDEFDARGASGVGHRLGLTLHAAGVVAGGDRLGDRRPRGFAARSSSSTAAASRGSCGTRPRASSRWQ